MVIEELRSRIATVNNTISRMNTQRNQNIGRQEALSKQLKSAFEQYSKKYGVELSVENLESEIKAVSAQKEAELAKLESLIRLINEGRINEANELAGVVEPDNTSVEEMKKTVEAVKESLENISGSPASASKTDSSASVPPTSPVPSTTSIPNILTPPVGVIGITDSAPKVFTPVIPVGGFNIEVEESEPKGSTSNTVTGASTLMAPPNDNTGNLSLGGLSAPPPIFGDTPKASSSGITNFNAILSGSAFKVEED